MSVVNSAMVSHHANRLLMLVAGDDDGPLTPVSDIVMGWPEGRFHAVDSDGTMWEVSIRPCAVQGGKP